MHSWPLLCQFLSEKAWYQIYIVLQVFKIEMVQVVEIFLTGDKDPALLTHWGWVMGICISKLSIIGSDNGLSPDRHQAIIRINAGILLIQTLGTNFSEILGGILIFSLKKMHLKMLSAKWWPFCLGLNVLTHEQLERHGRILSTGLADTLVMKPQEPLLLTWINFNPNMDK